MGWLSIYSQCGIKLIQGYFWEKGMSKQKLAELVMLKMQQKREEEQRNQPHFQVLQLLVTIQIQQYHTLTQQITNLKSQLTKQQEQLTKIDNNCQQLQNTGKKNYPRILIQPNFIASEHIPVPMKEFYRKSSYTFLREDLLKHKIYDKDCEQLKEIKEKYEQLKKLENQLQKKNCLDVKTRNEKRVRNLKEDLRLRALRQEIIDLNKQIEEQKNNNQSLLNEYELKKTNLHKRVEWSKKLHKLIKQQKQLIEKVYNPVSYREYLKTVFGIRIKNENMHKSLLQVLKEVAKVQQKTETNERFLQKNDKLVVIGRCADSPSRSRRKKRTPRSLQIHRSQTPTQNKNLMNSYTDSPTLKEKVYSHKHQRTLCSSIGKTTLSSSKNIKESSQRKRCRSSFTQLKHKKIKPLQF